MRAENNFVFQIILRPIFSHVVFCSPGWQRHSLSPRLRPRMLRNLYIVTRCADNQIATNRVYRPAVMPILLCHFTVASSTTTLCVCVRKRYKNYPAVSLSRPLDMCPTQSWSLICVELYRIDKMRNEDLQWHRGRIPRSN